MLYTKTSTRGAVEYLNALSRNGTLKSNFLCRIKFVIMVYPEMGILKNGKYKLYPIVFSTLRDFDTILPVSALWVYRITKMKNSKMFGSPYERNQHTKITQKRIRNIRFDITLLLKIKYIAIMLW